MEKTDFLISPAYDVPPISTVLSAKLTTMKVPAPGAVDGRIGFEAGRLNDGEPGGERREFIRASGR